MGSINRFDLPSVTEESYRARRDGTLEGFKSEHGGLGSYEAFVTADSTPRALLAAPIDVMIAAKQTYGTLALMQERQDLPIVSTPGFQHPSWIDRFQMVEAIMQTRAVLALAGPEEKAAFIVCECQKTMDGRAGGIRALRTAPGIEGLLELVQAEIARRAAKRDGQYGESPLEPLAKPVGEVDGKTYSEAFPNG